MSEHCKKYWHGDLETYKQAIEDILNEPDLMDLSLVAISKELEIRNFFTLMQMKYGPQIHVKDLTGDEKELYNKIYNAIIYNSSFDINDDEED